MDPVISSVAARVVDEVGGKATSLNALIQAGFRAPDFFVIRAEAIRDGQPSSTLEDALPDALRALGDGPFAVRSSGRAEDGAEHSHAGQFETLLNVATGEVLAAAVKVWKSGFSETVATYRNVKTGGTAEAPAIIVQRMIPADTAGIAFSADPVTGLRDRVVISAISGLGEQLVSGEADGEDWVVGSDNTPLKMPDQPEVLSADQAADITDLARRAEEAFGRPQDIEWAIADGILYILQSRPITTELRPHAVPDDALIVLDNSNIVESYPGLVSPLTYSFAAYVYARVYRAFVRLLGVREPAIAAHAAVFDNMLARVDGRVYYNLGNWYRALALLPGFSLNRAYMETMMGVSEPLPAELTDSIGAAPARGFGRVMEWLKVLPVGLGLIWQASILPRTCRRFYARLGRALDQAPDLKAANLTTLADEYRKIEAELLDQWDAPLINDFLCMIGFGASRNMLEKWLGEDGLHLHNDLMIGQGDIVSAEPAQRIAKMGAMVRVAGIADRVEAEGRRALRDLPTVEAEVNAYIAKFGDRCTQELKLESIPLDQDDTALIAAIAASGRREAAPVIERRDPDWSTLFASKPVRRIIARGFTNWAKARVRDRENLRFERTRIFGHARRVFLAMGRELTALGHLDADRDIFLLTVEEVLGAVEGNALSQDLKALVALRRAEEAASATRADPPERILVRGAAVNLPIEHQSSQVELSTAQSQTATGCSAGQVTATARVITDPRTQTLTPGEILIATNTDPGWIAVFSNASAIVVERGSLLSHSAIVARELGIPCVVGLKDATRWITSGEQIEVNGKTGEVRKLE